MEIAFNRAPPEADGKLNEVAPGIRRMVAGNAGPFTFTGTCTYVVGHGAVSVIDPGPDDRLHIERLLAALANETIGQILVTHTHRDHSPGARLLQERTGAPIVGAAPHQAFRASIGHEAMRLDASADFEHAPDRVLADGEIFEADGHRFRAIATPGHTLNHLAFALEETGMLFSGDHVMAWSTSIVAPPDGAMAPYMASLEKLAAREDTAFWPGHGGPVRDPRRFTRGLLTHRRQRETQVIERLRLGSATIPEMVTSNYPGLDPALRGAAALSVFAHVEDLLARGIVTSEGPATLDAHYTLV